MTTRKMVFTDTSLCTGCKACSVACKAWNDLPAEKTDFVTSYQVQKETTAKTWTYVSFHEKYEDGKMNLRMFKHQCYHCGEPACMKACSSGAISKTESGYTLFDHDKCVGCGYCVANCPWNVPRLDPDTGKSTKCTGCIDRVENGILPACAYTCQPGAIQFGEYNEILKKARIRLAEVLEFYPKANIYGEKLMGGTTYIYLLMDEPKAYGLPKNPSTPWSLYLWKDIIHPLGGIAFGGAAAAVAAGVIANFARGNYRSGADDENVDSHHDSKLGG